MLHHQFLACSNDPDRGAFQAHQTLVTLGSSPSGAGVMGALHRSSEMGLGFPASPASLQHAPVGRSLSLSRLTPAFVLFPDCDTGVKRPIGGDGQEAVQPGTVVKTRTL